MKIKMSTAQDGTAILKWVAIIAFVAVSAAAGLFYLRDSNARADLERAHAEAQDAAQKLAELQAAPQAPAKPSEESNNELVKLRGDVSKYREMEKQYKALQTEAQQLRAHIAQLEQVGVEAAALRNANAQLQQTAQDQAAVTTCVANLRIIAAAKNQWAAQNIKGPNDMPIDVDIFGKYIPQKPVCPKGGVYTLGAVGAKPTCSVPGHTM
jgi:hypothetical protein